MSNSRENFIKTINHQQPDRIVVDFGATPVSGIHVSIVEKLREYYGFDKKPIKVIEPFQMLGEVDDELGKVLGIDTMGIAPLNNMFGVAQENWKTFITHWGQEVMVAGMFNTTINENGDRLMYPEGDTTIKPSAIMPKSSYFFDAIIRQEAIDDGKLNPEDNLEEFSLFSDKDLKYWKQQAENTIGKEKAVVANFGGTAVGDIALVPAINLKAPKGIRDVAEWYMSSLMRTDYLHQIFEKQTDIALENLKMMSETLGNSIDVVFLCGTDFGTQDSTFCSQDTFIELYSPYYRKMNDWIHQNTGWKTFKHSCGAVESFMKHFIDAGFDIINPVQINAAGMNSKLLKREYGDKLVFWGGGIDTQIVLPFGTPEEVRKQVLEQCEIMSKNGGFVFNTVHNIQANVPIENIVAMLEAIQEFNKY